MKTAFITSTGRTATDFFTTLFNDVVQNSWSLHEPRPAFKRRGRRMLSQPAGWWDKNYFRLSRQLRAAGHTEQWYVETNYHLFMSIPLIREAFPDALVAHICRDGRNVVTSWLNRWRYIVYQHMTPFEIPGDPARAQWDDWNPLQKLSWYWKTVNQIVRKSEPEIWVRFEDLFAGDPQVAFDILARFDGIEFREEDVIKALGHKVNAAKNDFFPKYAQWPEQWKEQFWDIAGDEMTLQGYSKD